MIGGRVHGIKVGVQDKQVAGLLGVGLVPLQATPGGTTSEAEQGEASKAQHAPCMHTI